ncbi:MAG TPA: S9 family peptidase, partial [Vicinamibacteria bacterium]|nr:S9 family peptidase [Vicinamibacteria bacterium]
MKIQIPLLSLLLVSPIAPLLAASSVRPLSVDDIYNLKDVAEPRISPDGRWAAYTVSSLDRKTDEGDTDVYMVSLAGGEPMRLTTSPKPETSPRFSPDGKYLAFLSPREGKKAQVWLLNRT